MSLTILIVEDEKHARENIRDILSAKGFNTLEADTLKSARKHIDLGNADIILLDVMLPDGNGPVLLEETAHINPRPPIILVTGHGDIEMAVKAMKNGAHDFLQKPIQVNCRGFAKCRQNSPYSQCRESNQRGAQSRA